MEWYKALFVIAGLILIGFSLAASLVWVFTGTDYLGAGVNYSNALVACLIGVILLVFSRRAYLLFKNPADMTQKEKDEYERNNKNPPLSYLTLEFGTAAGSTLALLSIIIINAYITGGDWQTPFFTFVATTLGVGLLFYITQIKKYTINLGKSMDKRSQKILYEIILLIFVAFIISLIYISVLGSVLF